MKILIACEESQAICKEFRRGGHESYSCDIQDCSGGHPEWHIKGDALLLINGNCEFETCDNTKHIIEGKWDLLIAHPPCTYLSNVATRHHSLNCTSLEKINERTLKRIEAMEFFMKFIMADCEHIAVENPIGVMNTCYRKADQIIHPYMFVDCKNSDEYVTKATCLWFKNLPDLVMTNNLEKPNNFELFGCYSSGKNSCWQAEQHGSVARSKTFLGIAKAIAEQWGSLEKLNKKFKNNNETYLFKKLTLDDVL